MNRKKKTIIITILSLIIVLLLIFVVLFLIKKDTKNITNYDSLKNLLTESDSKLYGFVWVDSLEYINNTISFNLYQKKENIVIPLDKIKSEYTPTILIGDNPTSPSLIYISFEYTDKQECLLFFCNNEFKRITLYNGVYIVQNLKYDQLKEELQKDIKYLITEYTVDKGNSLTEVSSLLSEYVYLSKSNSDNDRLSNVRTKLLSKRISLDLALSKAKFLDKGNVIEIYIKESICNTPKEEDAFSLFSDLILNEFCDSKYEISDSEVLTILKPEVKEELYMSDLVTNSINISYLYDSKNEVGLAALANVEDFVKQGFLFGKNTPYCTPNATVYCTKDFLLNMLLFLEIQNEESI